MSTIPVIRSYAPYEVHFDDYEVPGREPPRRGGRGLQARREWLVHARVPYAAGTIGIAQAALEARDRLGTQRETFGTTLADKQAIQWMIADSEIELRAARLLVYQAAWHGDLGRDIKVDASVAKVYAHRDGRARSSTAASRCSAASAWRRRCRSSAGTASCASSASAKGRRKCTAW